MPVVTVSAELGSDGERIAQGLAERLGLRYIDRSVLIEAARAYDVPGVRASAPELAERAPSFWERLNEERRRYNVLLRAVIYRFAAEGDCVIIGSGGGLLLRDVRHVLKVRVIAPRELRIQRLMATVDTRDAAAARAAAEERLRQSDRDRSRYIRYLFNVDWADPAPYDLVLNTRVISPLTAIELLAGLVARPEFQPTADSEALLQDLALGSQVEAILMHDPHVWVENLRVSARGGEVTLSGQVLAEEDREAAEAVARRVSGVQVVRNEIAVQPPPLAGM
ncbi:MAG TPA: cytidylate kinase family protein [Chloroflexota bacterium]|nr:cytidylate kinase family protein [Chloroflexota bacterium]